MTAHPSERPARLCILHADEAICGRLKICLSAAYNLAVSSEPLSCCAATEHAIERSDAALFLLDEHALSSGFFTDPATPALLQRQRDAGTPILFVVAARCRWKDFDYIAPLLPHPITQYAPASLAYTHIADEIGARIASHPRRHKSAQKKPLAPAPRLSGRDAELAWLASARRGIFVLVAEDGTGKSALTGEYLASQSSISHTFHPRESSRLFLLAALRRLGVLHDARTSDEELGRMLGCEAATRSVLLVLEDIEAMLAADGKIVDRGLIALFDALLENAGRCIASSARQLAQSDRVVVLDMGPLAPEAACALLRQRGVRGAEADIGKMAKRCNRHPLSLALAAEFCHAYLDDDAAAFVRHAWYPNSEKSHAAAVAQWFDVKIGEDRLPLDRELLRIAALFDRPAPWGALLALKRAKSIPGLTIALHASDEAGIRKSLARLSMWGLIECDPGLHEPEIRTHPSLALPFREQLKKEQSRAAHSVLFDWYSSLPGSERPDSLEELEPLYRAIVHGCRAGRYHSAYQNIYLARILRGSVYYTQNQLGAYSCDMNALAEFFPEGWNQLPAEGSLPGEHLSEAQRSRLISDVAYALKSQGMLTDALGPQRIDYRRTRDAADWNNFCRCCENLVSLLTPLGRWAEAEAVSREAVAASNKVENAEDRWQRTTTALSCLGHTLHGRGHLAQAATAYELAEMVQGQAHHHPKLYSVYGYNYAQLLLEQASCESGWREVLTRRHGSLDIALKLDHPLSQALDHSAIGLAGAALGEPDSVQALDLAITTMQRAGTTLHLPAMHLARAHYLRSLGDLQGAQADLNTAFTIAERSDMRSYLAECELLAGNLALDLEKTDDAGLHHAAATRLIVEDGYGRRIAELHLLHARLLHAMRDPDAQSALNAARTRICAAGQWYFWRELRRVAAEILAPDPGECPARVMHAG